MSSPQMTLDDRGRVVIPQAIRDAQGLKAGDRLMVFDDGQGITLMTLEQLEAKVVADWRAYPGSPVDELIAERHAEAQRDLKEP